MTPHTLYSINPDGEKFPLPEKKDFQPEFERLKVLADHLHSRKLITRRWHQVPTHPYA
mgnify:CR=1 FL=1